MKISPAFVRHLVIGAIGLQLIGFVLAWGAFLPQTFFMHLWPSGLDAASARALAPSLKMTGALFGLPSLLTLCYGLWRLAQLAANMARTAPFDLANIAHLRGFAGAILVSTVLSIIEVPLRILVWRAAFDLRGMMSIGVSGDQLLMMLMCGLFYLVVRVMHEGHRLARENEGFV